MRFRVAGAVQQVENDGHGSVLQRIRLEAPAIPLI
jgi:hypothetical protein